MARIPKNIPKNVAGRRSKSSDPEEKKSKAIYSCVTKAERQLVDDARNCEGKSRSWFLFDAAMDCAYVAVRNHDQPIPENYQRKSTPHRTAHADTPRNCSIYCYANKQEKATLVYGAHVLEISMSAFLREAVVDSAKDVLRRYNRQIALSGGIPNA